jgi:hypothetical protein
LDQLWDGKYHLPVFISRLFIAQPCIWLLRLLLCVICLGSCHG